MSISPSATHVVSEWKHDSPLIACRFDPLSRYVFTSAEDNSLQRWNLADGAKTVFKAHDSWVFALGVSGDGNLLVTGGGDGRLVWWPVADAEPKPIRTIDAHAGWIRAVAVSPDGTKFASAGNDRLVKLWNFADGALLQTLAGHECHVYSVCWHPSGQMLLSGDLKGQVHQWDLATGKPARTFDAKPLWSYNGGQQVDFGGVRGLAVSPDSKYLACGGLQNASNPLGAVHDPVTLLFEWDSQKLAQTHIADGLKGVVWRNIFHPEGWLLGISGGSSGGTVSFWKPDQPKEAHRFQLPNIARDGDLHPNGEQLATTHYDRQVRICRMVPKS